MDFEEVKNFFLNQIEKSDIEINHENFMNI